MADTVPTLEKATPYSLVYKLVGGATAGAIAPQTDAVPGPLKAFLKRLAAANAMATLNLDNASVRSRTVRIRHIEGSTDAQTVPGTRILVWTAAGLAVTTAVGSTSQIEIRLAQSVER
jgi:hypothetical protein